jgi:hypothetical protein
MGKDKPMTSMIRKLSAPLMMGHSLSSEGEDALDTSVMTSLAGLTIGFASVKMSAPVKPFALIGLGMAGGIGSMYVGLKDEGRERMRAASDAALAIGFSKVGESIAKGAGIKGAMHGELETSSGFGMLETSSSFGADSRDQMARAAADL